jgi:kynureninase
MEFKPTNEQALELDAADPLRSFRDQFIIPEQQGKQHTYLLGNSLGLQPKRTNEYLQRILQDWSSLGVESFFHAKEPWMDLHDRLTGPLAMITGAQRHEISVMNALTVNLHLMLVSFYRPTAKRYKIICEARAFPSDQYSFETHVRHHGFDPDDAVIEVHPRAGENTLRTEDIISVIGAHAEETALVLFGGINYYSGQLFDIAAITKAAHDAGAVAGFDLAHAAGNVALQLHDWQVDFACWCNYKYLNAGPGAVGAVFIHEKHHAAELPRFAGWWGYDKATRFKMEKGFKAMSGAEGWQLSTPSILLYASLRASLEIFMEAGWDNIQTKRKLLNDYLWYRLKAVQLAQPGLFTIITPDDPQARGCQVSLLVQQHGKALYDQLMQNGFIIDWREPNVIRLAPVPLYNSYIEIWDLTEELIRK